MLRYFYCGRSTAEINRIIYETCGKHILSTKVRANLGFKGFEMEISTLMTKLAVDGVKRMKDENLETLLADAAQSSVDSAKQLTVNMTVLRSLH